MNLLVSCRSSGRSTIPTPRAFFGSRLTKCSNDGAVRNQAIGLMAAVAVVLATSAEDETLSNIPPVLSNSQCEITPQDCKKPRIQRPKSRKAESCTINCVTTCIRGGEGSPGEGPLNVRRPIVVFKPGFHSRRYCLVECSDICNLLDNADDGP